MRGGKSAVRVAERLTVPSQAAQDRSGIRRPEVRDRACAVWLTPASDKLVGVLRHIQPVFPTCEDQPQPCRWAIPGRGGTPSWQGARAAHRVKSSTSMMAALIDASWSSESCPSAGAWQRVALTVRICVMRAQHSTGLPPVPAGRWTVKGYPARGRCVVSGITIAVPTWRRESRWMMRQGRACPCCSWPSPGDRRTR
jgi:hypothetical protein